MWFCQFELLTFFNYYYSTQCGYSWFELTGRKRRKIKRQDGENTLDTQKDTHDRQHDFNNLQIYIYRRPQPVAVSAQVAISCFWLPINV